jgi:UV DNA damage endonuclease
VTISSHPDQFNVLPSFSEATVSKTIKELNHQSFVLDMMGCPQDYRAPMCLHLNLSFDSSKETIADYIARFTINFNMCDAGVRKRLVLENEDKGFWNAQNLYRYFGVFLPLVFDNLHDACNPSEYCYFDLFKGTWKHYTPVMHWSEGIAEKPRSHTDYFSFVPSVVAKNTDCVWECEIKSKDRGIVKILEKNY